MKTCKWVFILFLSTGLLCVNPLNSAVAAAPSDTNLGTLKYEEPKLLTGRIYAKGSDRSRPLFSFRRVATRRDSTLEVTREYNYPDGKVAAREHVVYNADNLILYQLEELQI